MYENTLSLGKGFSNKQKHLMFFFVFCLLALFANIKFLIVIYAISTLTIFFPKFRKILLSVNIILAFFIINPYYFNTSIKLKLISFAFFVFFNFLWIMVIKKYKKLKNHPFWTMFIIAILMYGYVSMASKLLTFSHSIFIVFNPIFFSYFSYMGYAKYGLREMSIFDKILWIRPFWYIWIIPLGNLKEAVMVRDNPKSIEDVRPRLTKDLIYFSIFLLIYTLFENLVFNRAYYTHDVKFIPHLLNLSYTHTDGFESLLDGNISRSRMFFTQLFSTIHYIGSAYLYTTAFLVSVTLAGGLIHPHTENFWQAKSFSEFYFKTSYHYSVLIKYCILKPLIPVFKFIKSNDLRVMISIFISVSLVCMICMFFGRGLRFKGDIFSYTHAISFMANYEYAVSSGLVCAISNFLRTRKFNHSVASRFQAARIIKYLIITSFIYIFAFHYLLTSSALKYKFIFKIIGL